MGTPDYRGARGSNIGDDYHELWVLTQSLALLDQSSNIECIGVEGIAAKGNYDASTWDGVDTTLYIGGDSIETASEIIFDQVKYSGTNPNRSWTFNRLLKPRDLKDSIVGKFSKVFSALKDSRQDLLDTGKVKFRLVSNQPVAEEVANWVSNPTPELLIKKGIDLTTLGLTQDDLSSFLKCLDFSETGNDSRISFKENLIGAINELTAEPAGDRIKLLMRSVREMMFPESKGQKIRTETVLSWLGVSTHEALFPCPSYIDKEKNVINRQISTDIVNLLREGYQYICLHGRAGCGKTTAVQQIQEEIGSNAIVVVYDCYGRGRYLDADAYRHRAKDAFTQVINELAVKARLPLLINYSYDIDLVRVFKQKLREASELVSLDNPGKLILMVLDAADNSIIAAQQSASEEPSFVIPFSRIGDLPSNVRFLITTRTGRLDTLDLPHHYKLVAIEGFSRHETESHVRMHWADTPSDWIEEFHQLSDGNPRVQHYALELAKHSESQALNYLRPSGKSLEQIFSEQLRFAQTKGASDLDIQSFCASLAILPRPVPIGYLATATNQKAPLIIDLCSDLAPGVEYSNDAVGFRDEDFETFIRKVGNNQLQTIQQKIADVMMARKDEDVYAAAHVAPALYLANRRAELLKLAETEGEPHIISDLVLRKETYLQRIRLSTKVCREAGDGAKAVLILLKGAEALKTGEATEKILSENPVLSSDFAPASNDVLLKDPNKYELHGALLFHLIALNARKGNRIAAKQHYRSLSAWLQRRNQFLNKEKSHRISPQAWEITPLDIAGEAEAFLRLEGPKMAVEMLRRWKPRAVHLRTAISLSQSLIKQGEVTLLEACIALPEISSAWKLFLLVNLALSGSSVNLNDLQQGLKQLMRRGLLNPEILKETRLGNLDDDFYYQYFNLTMLAVEILVMNGKIDKNVLAVLDLFSQKKLRQTENLYTFQVDYFDIAIRAFSLRQIVKKKPGETQAQFLMESKPKKRGKDTEAYQKNQHSAELKEFLRPFLDFYRLRAQAILAPGTDDKLYMETTNAISKLDQDYRVNRDYRAREMSMNGQKSFVYMLMLKGLAPEEIWNASQQLLVDLKGNLTSNEFELFGVLSLQSSLHTKIISWINSRSLIAKDLRISATEKVDWLIKAANFQYHLSREDSKAIFHMAIEIAGEIDANALIEIKLFKTTAKKASAVTDENTSRQFASQLVEIFGDLIVRLEGEDGFPWDGMAQSLGGLDLNVALAAVARWEDEGIADRRNFMPGIIRSALQVGSLSAVQASSLVSLLDHFAVPDMGEIFTKAHELDEQTRDCIAEHFAKIELLHFGHPPRRDILEKLTTSRNHKKLFWVKGLQSTVSYLADSPQAQETDRDPDGVSHGLENSVEDLANRLGFPSIPVNDSKSIFTFVQMIKSLASETNQFISIDDILAWLTSNVEIKHRRDHLDALSDLAEDYDSPHALFQFIIAKVIEWSDSPSVVNWGRERLPNLILRYLPEFSRYIGYGESFLDEALKCTKLNEKQCADLMLQSLERHIDILTIPNLIGVLELTSQYCSAEENKEIFDVFSSRLLDRIPSEQRSPIDWSDLPKRPIEGLVRYLCALMSDVDVRIRWRAIHVFRDLVKLSNEPILDLFIGNFERKTDNLFRSPGKPFYWLSLKMWMLLGIERIAHDDTRIVANKVEWLYKIATDISFPHILIQTIAKSTILHVIQRHPNLLTKQQLASLRRSASQLTKKTRATQGHMRYSRSTNLDDFRFTFDSMDTLPYWYEPAVEMFADLQMNDFLRAAEKWIVDKWGVTENPWRWNDEPRMKRFSERQYGLWDHRHGSMPTLERYRIYLEWHAMMCAVGESLSTNALAKPESYSIYDLESWLKRYNISNPPNWLSDFHLFKPLEENVWFRPRKPVPIWIRAVSDLEYKTEIAWEPEGPAIIVGGHKESYGSDFSFDFDISSSLVHPKTSSSLMNALQTIKVTWDYALPWADGDHEFREGEYVLRGWLERRYGDSGIDEDDPFSYRISGLELRPSRELRRDLNLSYHFENYPEWISKSGIGVFSYLAWSDTGKDATTAFGDEIRSSGWRLLANKAVVIAYLRKINMDLIISIKVTKRNYAYEAQEYSKKEKQETKLHRIFLLKENGNLEFTRKNPGTRRLSRSRIGA